MKAIVFSEHGGPEVLRHTEVPEPKLGHGEVLVRVKACALNHLDLWVRKGLPGVQIPLPHIPGSDIAGEVAKIGEGVTRVKVGQKVVLAPGLACNACDDCIAGHDNLCRRYTIFGFMVDGGCAEYVRAPEVNVLFYPEGLSWEEAAAVPLVFLTAWHMLVGRAKLQPGEDVLILGAGSGIGSAAIQIATARASSPPPGRTPNSKKPNSSAPTSSSTTRSRTSPRKSKSARTSAAWTSSSSTSARPPGRKVCRAWRRAGAW